MDTTLAAAMLEASIIRTFTDPSVREQHIVALAQEVNRLRGEEDGRYEEQVQRWQAAENEPEFDL